MLHFEHQSRVTFVIIVAKNALLETRRYDKLKSLRKGLPGLNLIGSSSRRPAKLWFFESDLGLNPIKC